MKLFGLLLRVLLALVLVALLGFAAYEAHQLLGWGWFEMGAGLLIVLVLVFGLLLLRRWRIRRREERFIRSMVEHGVTTLSTGEEEERLAALRQRWARGLAMLRNANFSSDPLYTLPWFMLFGESGSGKSTSIAHARLSTAASDAGPLTHVPNTRNCDWWFFDKAIVLDTAGRYAVPLDEGADTREWEIFLNLLAVHRRREPLNGLILTLAADRLLSDSEDALTCYGRLLRKRMASIMRVLDARFPVYIMVTKMDRVFGFLELAELLPESERAQALGLLAADPSAAPVEAALFVDQALAHVRRRLQDMSLLLSVQADSHRAPGAMLSEEFARLEPGIRAFARGAFAPSEYDATPLLRGLFFSSGRQEGLVRPHIFEGLETFKDRTWTLPGTDKAFFLHDFFASILPRERSLATVVDSCLNRSSLRRHTGYLVWLGLLLALCGYFSVSFLSSLQLLETARREIPAKPDIPNTVGGNAARLSHIADVIASFEAPLNARWWMRPGFAQSDLMLDHLETRYTDWLRSRFFLVDESLINQRLRSSDPQQYRVTLVQLYEYLAWTTSVLEAVNAKRTPPPYPADDLSDFSNSETSIMPRDMPYLQNLFTSFAHWETPRSREVLIERQRQKMFALMNELGNDLQWIVQWLNARGSLHEIRFSTFWPGAVQGGSVPRAFSAQGYARMEIMLRTLEYAAPDKADFARRAAAFRQRYAQEFRTAWWKFAAEFNNGAKGLRSAEQWQRATVGMSSPTNIYFTFIRSMAENLAVVKHIGTPDAQDALPGAFVTVLDTLLAEADQAKTVREQIAAKTEALGTSLSKTRAAESSALAEQVKALGEYMNALKAVQAASRTDTDALTLARAGYTGGQEASATPISQSLTTLSTLKTLMDESASTHNAFWRLVEGPLAFQTSFAIYRAACALNENWENSVRAKIANLDAEKLWELLFVDPKSPLDDFVARQAAPFLVDTPKGWTATSWLGIRFPISPELTQLLDLGMEEHLKPQEKYVVGVTALPIGVNPEADKPYRATLTLDCVNGQQTLDNYNYPQSKDFTWEPALCKTVTLDIYVQNQHLRTQWEGHWPFQRFIRDTSGPGFVFTPEDFPAQREALEELDLKRMVVRYAFRHAEPVLALREYEPVGLPINAAFCPGPLDNNAGESAPLGILPFSPQPDMVPHSPRRHP